MINKHDCKNMKDIVGHFFDNLMWYVIYLLPFIMLSISWCHGDYVDLTSVFNSLNLSIVADNIVITSLLQVFGSAGVFPIFIFDSMIVYFAYFILMYLIHLMVDILLWVVRCIHHLINHGIGGASHE